MANDAGWFLIENILTFFNKNCSAVRSTELTTKSFVVGILAGDIYPLTPASGGHLQRYAFQLVRVSYGQTSLFMSPLIVKCYTYITHRYIVLPCKNLFFHQIFHDSYAQTDVG